MLEIKYPSGRYALAKKVVAIASDQSNATFLVKTGIVDDLVVTMQVFDSNGAVVLPDYKCEVLSLAGYDDKVIRVTKRTGGPNIVAGYTFNFLGVRKCKVL